MAIEKLNILTIIGTGSANVRTPISAQHELEKVFQICTYSPLNEFFHSPDHFTVDAAWNQVTVADCRHCCLQNDVDVALDELKKCISKISAGRYN